MKKRFVLLLASVCSVNWLGYLRHFSKNILKSVPWLSCLNTPFESLPLFEVLVRSISKAYKYSRSVQPTSCLNATQ